MIAIISVLWSHMVKKGDHGARALNRDKMQAVPVTLSFLVASWKS